MAKKKKPTKKVDSKDSKQLILYVVLVVIVVSTLFVSYSRRLLTVGKEQGLATASVLGIATQKIDNGVIEMSVGTQKPAAIIPKVYEVDEGTKAICVDVEVRNISGSEKLFIPLEEIELVDTNSKITYKIAGVLTCSPGVGGPVQVGEVIKGQLGFLLPEKHGKLEFRYNPLDKNTKSFIISNI